MVDTALGPSCATGLLLSRVGCCRVSSRPKEKCDSVNNFTKMGGDWPGKKPSTRTIQLSAKPDAGGGHHARISSRRLQSALAFLAHPFVQMRGMVAKMFWLE